MKRRSLFVAMIAVQLAICVAWLPRALRGGSDFRCFYAAGFEVLTGHGDALYSREISEPTQNRFWPGNYDPYTHPAYEALLFAIFAKFPYRTAAVVYVTLSAALLLFAAAYLSRLIDVRSRRDFGLMAAGFLPLGFTLTYGQDSIILLFLLAFSTYLFARNQPFAAGLFCGLGVFRFQLALPILFLFVAWRFFRFALGFIVAAIAAAGLSVATIGWSHSWAYLHLLVAMVRGNADRPYNQPLAQMPNLHGLITTTVRIFGGSPHSHWLTLVIVLSSLALIVWKVRQRPANSLQAMSMALPIAFLVGYHGFIHDASILLIPIALNLYGPQREERSGMALYLAPAAAIYRSLAFLGAIPILVSTFAPSGATAGTKKDAAVSSASVA